MHPRGVIRKMPEQPYGWAMLTPEQALEAAP